MVPVKNRITTFINYIIYIKSMGDTTYSNKTPFVARRSESPFIATGQVFDTRGNVRIVMDKESNIFLVEKLSNPERFLSYLEDKLEQNKIERQRAENEAECLMLLQGVEGVQKLAKLPFYQFQPNGDTSRATFHIPCKFINGLPLSVYVGNLDLQKRVETVYEIANTVKEIHSKGIIHQDISPYNIIVGHDRSHLIDFGLSRIKGKKYSARLAKVLRENCSPDYGSPEQKEGKTATEKSDIYSLGRILYFVLNAVETKKFGVVDYGAPYAKQEKLLSATAERAIMKNPSERPTIDGFISLLEAWQMDKKPLAR
jgi:serine/threonine protein kinase